METYEFEVCGKTCRIKYEDLDMIKQDIQHLNFEMQYGDSEHARPFMHAINIALRRNNEPLLSEADIQNAGKGQLFKWNFGLNVD